VSPFSPGGGGLGRDDSQIGDEGVGYREAAEEGSPGADGAEFGIDGWVDEELHRNA
jgi:hypothetical protein